eukprot:2517152-Pleurochrysis_carterae.AAC.3
MEEVAGMHETGMMLPYAEAGGLIANNRLQNMRMWHHDTQRRADGTGTTGMRVGKHEHGLGDLDVHCAHYVDTGSFDVKDDEAMNTTRLLAHVIKPVPPSVVTSRKEKAATEATVQAAAKAKTAKAAAEAKRAADAKLAAEAEAAAAAATAKRNVRNNSKPSPAPKPDGQPPADPII